MKCPNCGTAVETRLERRRSRLRAAGRCIDCGKPRDQFMRCRDCRIKQAQYRSTSKTREASREI